MRIYLFLIINIWFGACSSNTKNDNQILKSSNPISPKHDSIEISHSNEYSRLIEFLKWYKAGHDKLYMPRIEKHFTADTLFYAYVDTLAARELLLLYRKSGYFTESYVKKDSLYIEKAKNAYQQKDLEIYDYFDHDFILKTQEVEETLEAISNTYVLADHTDLDSNKVAVSIGGYMNLRFTFKNENGQLRIDQIENLGIPD